MNSHEPFDQDSIPAWRATPTHNPMPTEPPWSPPAPRHVPPPTGATWATQPPQATTPTWDWPAAAPPAPPTPPTLPAGTGGFPQPSSTPPGEPRRRHRLAAGCAAAVLVVAGGFAGGFAGNRIMHDEGTSHTSVAANTVSDRTAASSSGSAIDAPAVLASMTDSVVSIQAKVTTDNGPWQSESEGEDEGTGIVIDDSGDILTNAHVVANAQSLTVTLPGSTVPRSASLVGSDANNDVAVVRVSDTTGLKAATLASSDNAEVGEGVVAIGNALALKGSLTVTEGIVSAANRSIQTEESSSLTGLLQTDAAISSGNSGGPLVNAQGTVIAMNTAVASSSDQVQASNIGFAIPIRHALSEVSGWLNQG